MRNVALMAETVQSDVRHSLLMFMVDFANQQAYGTSPHFEEALQRYDPVTGRIAHEVIKESKKILKIIVILGGQWPHTSFMVPGGVASCPEKTRVLQCDMIVRQFQSWYEKCVLGCSLKTWQQVQSLADLENWLADDRKHRNSEIGFFLRCVRETGMAGLGIGPNRFLSFGNYSMPMETSIRAASNRFNSRGYAEGLSTYSFDENLITEDVSHSWYKPQGKEIHPFEGETVADENLEMNDSRYSWVKAPRYDTHVVETGPLAEMIIDGHPLFNDLIRQNGPDLLVRQLARLLRPALQLPVMSVWLRELAERSGESFIKKVMVIPDGKGAGLIQAARGALGHWVKIKDGKIEKYQIITPTAWNGSPRDRDGKQGAWEQALTGVPIKDVDNPVEAGHVIRSYDPCMVCSVHAIQHKDISGRGTSA